MNFIPLAAAQPQGGGIQMIVMLVGLFAIVYFFMIRPQNKKQKEIQKISQCARSGARRHHHWRHPRHNQTH